MASPVCGLILLGNSGVGKSFLANRLLNDDDAFESRFSAKSITRRTEWQEMRSADGSEFYAVANIPGLIEANQSLVDENRHEIMKALEQYSLSIVIFVFGHRNGRIPDEDLVAFERIVDAYTFARQSVILIVNGIPADRPDGYEETTGRLLSELTGVDADRIYFIERDTSGDNKRAIHELLLQAVAQCKPAHHPKKHDIILVTDDIVQLKAQSKRRQEQLWLQQNDQKRSSQTRISLTPEVTPSIEHNEIMSTIMDDDRRLHQWSDSQQAGFDQASARIERLKHRRTSDGQMQLADQVKRQSEENMAMTTRLTLPPPIVVVTDRKSSKSHGVIPKGLDRCRSVPKRILSMIDPESSPHERTSRDEYQTQNDHSHGQASLPPHAYDPRTCKH